MNMKNAILVPLAVSLLLFLSGCVSGTLLTTHSVAMQNQPEKGPYTLILYGGQNPYDFASVAILDREDDQYRIQPYGSSFNYRTFEGVAGADAIERGNRFLANLSNYRRTELREIFGPGNAVIGYEMRPIFLAVNTGGFGDILDTMYVLKKNNLVMAYISLTSWFTDPLDNRGDSFQRDR